jgi:MFS family permease
LVTLRLVQAVGAAMLQANSVALVTTSTPKARMRFALGVQAGAQPVPPVATSRCSGRWC